MHKHRLLFKIPNPYWPERRKAWGVSNLLAVHLTTNTAKEWCLKFMFGRGAGYIWGRTLYLAYNCRIPSAAQGRGQSWYKRFAPKPWEYITVHSDNSYVRNHLMEFLQFGFTRNANIVPYVGG